MRQYREPIPVETKDARPTSLIWNGSKYNVVEILDEWLWAGKWWWNGTAQRRKYIRLAAVPLNRGEAGRQRVFEIYWDGSEWMLGKVLD